jgi:hypothetical protein
MFGGNKFCYADDCEMITSIVLLHTSHHQTTLSLTLSFFVEPNDHVFMHSFFFLT